jgi:hypothetical protein
MRADGKPSKITSSLELIGIFLERLKGFFWFKPELVHS